MGRVAFGVGGVLDLDVGGQRDRVQRHSSSLLRLFRGTIELLFVSMARKLGAWLLILVTGQRWFFEQFLAGKCGILNFKRLLMIIICYWLQQLAECDVQPDSWNHMLYFSKPCGGSTKANCQLNSKLVRNASPYMPSQQAWQAACGFLENA